MHAAVGAAGRRRGLRFVARHGLFGLQGSGVRAQAPFAVARFVACGEGVEEVSAAVRGGRPRAWAGERMPGPGDPATTGRMQTRETTGSNEPKIAGRFDAFERASV